jgi:hypothetical protein
MNALRRKIITKLISQIEEIRETIESLKDTEQECFDNMPESIQDGENGQKLSDNVDNFDNVYSNLEDCISELTEIVER